MTQLPAHERRRIFLAQQEASRQVHERLLAPAPIRDSRPEHARHRRTWLIATLAAGVILGGGLVLGDVVSFHVPASLVDAVWPRL